MRLENPIFCVVMPVCSDSQYGQKRKLIEEVAREFGLTTLFPKYTKDDSGFDPKATLRRFQEASFALVDLSLERPSCYYELGLAEAIGTKIFVFAEQGTPIHQTSHRNEVIYYRDPSHFKDLIRDAFSKEEMLYRLLTS